ncbi:MAG: hypothetical protein KBD01_02780 [Acidobacteria bacterium]|nr:hypothetical protein [Acidobacteriota bacterium]
MSRRWMLVVLLLPAILTLWSCTDSGDDDNDGRVVRYLLTSTCTADVAYLGAHEIEREEDDVSSGWRFSFQGSKGDEVYIGAMLDCDGTVTVEIFKDDRRYRSATASGPAAFAEASGKL